MHRLMPRWPIFLAPLVLPALLLAADKPVAPALSPELRGLLVQEMQQVLRAAQDIYRAVATGEHETVARHAQAIHDSFILNRALTPAQREELHAAAPEDFVALDRAFHRTAAQLAEAARARDSARELFFYSHLTAACVDCHRRFAGSRFPGLRARPAEGTR